MRRELIEALSYPRLLVQHIIDTQDCPHDSLFDATSERCLNCDINQQCHWVSCLDDFADFEGKPAYLLNASLRYGIRLVESMHGDLHHDESICNCEPCAWVRTAQRLTEEFELQLPPNPYRPVN